MSYPRQITGLLRSLFIYYANPFKLRRMQRFYSQFIKPGDLCFDIGAHVGNRLWAWSGLGAKVVAVEPQPICMAVLQRFYGKNAAITLLPNALGAKGGAQTLWISEQNPTVTTLSKPWIDQVRQDVSFAGVEWQQQVTVQVTTLDELIDCYGLPRFCKIDVEGYEMEVLRGLSQPLPVLSFEYLSTTPELALVCVDRLAELGTYQFNWSAGEQHRWQSARWLHADEMKAWLVTLPKEAGSGDIYARRID
ncbi:MAG: FkbM family methyltransferase [Caldilineaceae bacterium]